MRRYALALLFCAYVVNYVDRQVITVLQDPIKRDLHLTDTQLGLMTGLSFALFYAVLGLPIARIADRRSRKTIITISMSLWSLMTALCATAGSFATMLLFRVGVGVGEAGLTPPAHSLISDYYEPEKRASALSIYQASGTVGLMIGFLAGGWINQYFGWRAALLVVGGPGLLLALLIWLTLKEPRRGQFDSHGEGDVAAEFGALGKNPAFWFIALGCGLHGFVTYGQGNWTAPFFGRVHHMTTGEIGSWMAALSVGPSLFGMIAVGYFADWLAKRRPQARLEVAIVSIALIVPCEVGGMLAHDKYVAIAFFAGSFFLGGAYLAPSIAAAHALVPSSVRASASAVIMLSINLLGLGMGPFVSGVLSDHWAAWGAESLRYAMLAIVPAELAAIALFARAMQLSRRA
jgi:predicted MFS family arabinose efflux permease